jgi:spoIIIJ-associated protein
VVLDAGAPAGPGQPARAARIAVLLAESPAPQAARPAASEPRAPQAAPAGEPEEAIAGLVRALGTAAGLEMAAELTAGPDTAVVRITGADDFLLQDEAEPLRALEHLLQRALGDRVEGRLVVDVAGYRGAREARLQAQARAWAEEVRRTGRARETPPMNAYDRRLVHLALGSEPGIRTFSVGEGAGRRVTIAPAP